MIGDQIWSKTLKMKILIYSKDNCPWCEKARAFLNKKGLSYREIKLGVDYTREELKTKIPHVNPLTVPQIWINDIHIGGFTDLEKIL